MRELDTIFVCLEMYLLMAKPNSRYFWFLCASLKERRKMGPSGNGECFLLEGSLVISVSEGV